MTEQTSRSIGIDIGGTKIAVGIVNGEGRIEAQTQFPTDPRGGFGRAVEGMARAVGELCRKVGCDANGLRGIGVGCPGPLDPLSGVLHNDFTLPTWEGCNLITSLRDATKLPVRLENDADAALLGEVWVGAARGCKNVAMLTFGTGAGSAVVVEGRLFRAGRREHPEIGHIAVDPAGPACYCGIDGCLEILASGPGIAAQGAPLGCADTREVFTRAAAGDVECRRIVDRAVAACCSGVWTTIHIFLPELVLMGGGIMDASYQWFEPSLQKLVSNVKMYPQHQFRIAKAQLGNAAGLVGAASLVFLPSAD